MLHRDERKTKEAKNQKAFRDQNPGYPGKGWADGEENTDAVHRPDPSFGKRKAKGEILYDTCLFQSAYPPECTRNVGSDRHNRGR